ncbi:MAG TPA: hypothetical protein VK148_08115 [Xanthobacteraceae bacterium]|nr:hypothetical protein [Xanthobacteraceae bacterium]
MVERLLDRQVSLLEYLTSSGAIYGASGAAVADQAPPGFDPGMLRLEACFSHEKRMDKIQSVFPQTFRLLGDARAGIVRDFAATFPPVDISRLANARQFHEFLRARWQESLPEPPHLRDVAACEFAFAMARAPSPVDEELPPAGRPARGAIRRHPGIILLSCEYDVRPVFEAQGQDQSQDQSRDPARAALSIRRETLLAIFLPPGEQHPQTFEILPVVFDLLAVLEDWTVPSEFVLGPESDELIRELADSALIEVRL